MGRHKRKQFIDKKNAVTFHLVHRSQRDPLQADEESSRYVLQESFNLNEKKLNQEEKKKEQQKYGIFFEDDYDYTQHLREVKAENVMFSVQEQHKQNNQTEVQLKEDIASQPKLQLPSDVFASTKEDDIGLLNKAAPISGPRFDLDPDVVAAMDDDFDLDDPDNILDDDFVLKAQDMAPIGEEENRHGMSDEYDYSDNDGSYGDISSGGEFGGEGFDDDKEETKSRFTSYSLSSSVIRRNEGLTLLDDRFEKIYEEYDDMEMGALDHDDIEGFVHDNSEFLNKVLSEFEESQKKLVLEKEPTGSKEETNKGEDEDSDGGDEDEDDDDDLVKMKFEERQKETWDCESILSTYSNLYNHPKIIEDPPKVKKSTERTGTGTIKLSQKTGMPLGVLPVVGPTRKQLERQEIEEYRVPLMVQPRKKGQKETAEERKERKQAIKSERKVRRMEKKANKEAFKEEEKVQKKVMMNLQTNMQGVKIT